MYPQNHGSFLLRSPRNLKPCLNTPELLCPSLQKLLPKRSTQPLPMSGLNLTKRIESDFPTLEDHLKKGTQVCLVLEICTKEKSGFFSKDSIKFFMDFDFVLFE